MKFSLAEVLSRACTKLQKSVYRVRYPFLLARFYPLPFPVTLCLFLLSVCVTSSSFLFLPLPSLLFPGLPWSSLVFPFLSIPLILLFFYPLAYRLLRYTCPCYALPMLACRLLVYACGIPAALH